VWQEKTQRFENARISSGQKKRWVRDMNPNPSAADCVGGRGNQGAMEGRSFTGKKLGGGGRLQKKGKSDGANSARQSFEGGKKNNWCWITPGMTPGGRHTFALQASCRLRLKGSTQRRHGVGIQHQMLDHPESPPSELTTEDRGSTRILQSN